MTTSYAETEILLAALQDDVVAGQRLLSSLLPGERAELLAACETIARWCEQDAGPWAASRESEERV